MSKLLSGFTSLLAISALGTPGCASDRVYEEVSLSQPLACCGESASGFVINSSTSLPLAVRVRMVWEATRPDGEQVRLDAVEALDELIALTNEQECLLDRRTSGSAATMLTLVCIDPPIAIESQSNDRQQPAPDTKLPFFFVLDPEREEATTKWPPGIRFGTSVPRAVRSRVLRGDERSAGVWSDTPAEMSPVATWWGSLEFRENGEEVRVVAIVHAAPGNSAK